MNKLKISFGVIAIYFATFATLYAQNEQPALPKSIIGLDFNGYKQHSEYTGGFETVDSDYQINLTGYYRPESFKNTFIVLGVGTQLGNNKRTSDGQVSESDKLGYNLKLGLAQAYPIYKKLHLLIGASGQFSALKSESKPSGATNSSIQNDYGYKLSVEPTLIYWLTNHWAISLQKPDLLYLNRTKRALKDNPVGDNFSTGFGFSDFSLSSLMLGVRYSL